MSEPQIAEEFVYPYFDDEYEFDYSSCDYFLRCQGVAGYENGTCTFGCWEEPRCITG